MKKRSFIICLIVFAIFLITAQDSVTYASNSEKPVNISITFTKNSSTEKSVTWVTKSPLLAPAVLVVWEEGELPRTFVGESKILTGRREYYADQSLFNGGNNLFNFRVSKVTATGLAPDTKYMYYCGDGTPSNWSDTFTFETGSETGEFSFLYLTDPQGVTDEQFEMWRKCAERAYAKFPEAKFAAIAGDLVDRGSSENLWDKFFFYGSKMLSNLTVVPVIGNHETSAGPHHFSDHFAFPGNVAGLPDYVYSFDYGDAHFMVMSTEKRYADFVSEDQTVKDEAYVFLDTQLNWLRYEVMRSKKKWNIVILHKGIYTNGGHADSNETQFYQKKIAPVFDELSIDAVLQGHNHIFEKGFIHRGWQVPGLMPHQTAVYKEKGTFYLTNNTSGAKFYEVVKVLGSSPLMRSEQPKTQMYTGVTVSEAYLRFETYAVSEQGEDGPYDTFVIYK